jgi:hypothetical protein
MAQERSMSNPHVRITAPLVSDRSALWFSAFGFGWGYGAFEITFDTICQELGATNTTQNQLLQAFELGKHRIVRAVLRRTISSCGERITLSPDDF